VYGGVSDLLPQLDHRMGAAVLAEEALDQDAAARLSDALDRQPSWSDLPIVLLSGLGVDARIARGVTASFVADRLTARGSVTVLERPVGVATLASAVSAALRARTRQLEVRDHLEARERARADAEHARAEAEAANRAKADFLAAMSHELRTPLNAILGYAQLLQLGLRGPITAEQAEAVQRISTNQRHLQGVVEDILTFSRAERGELPLDIQDVPLDEVLATVHVAIEPQLRQNRLAYEYHPCPPDVVARTDRARLQQVVINFLSNAAKFTPAGGRVTLGCTRENGTAYIRVRDTGIGIPQEKLERIFEPFVQVSEGYTRTAEGSGLGLAISRDLARLMGGDVTVESEVGKGSTFTVSVPVRAPEAR
jgi:signal transduction histidine kinase